MANVEMELTKEHIDQALKNTSWDFLNKQLYELCRANPDHKSEEVILAKVVMIGRTYSAALERRKTKSGNRRGIPDSVTNESANNLGDTYLLNAAKIISRSNIDAWLAELKNSRLDTLKSLETHKNLVCLFQRISGQANRSLASKYLHFHLPEHFYIYDSRAASALKTLIGKKWTKTKLVQSVVDSRYANLFAMCDQLASHANQLVGRSLIKRDIDKILLHYAAKNKEAQSTT